MIRLVVLAYFGWRSNLDRPISVFGRFLLFFVILEPETYACRAWVFFEKFFLMGSCAGLDTSMWSCFGFLRHFFF